jgi:hypothetical protein
MSQDRHTVPDWELVMYRLGELQPARAQRIEARLADEPKLAARLAALEGNEAELMERLPPRVLATRVAEGAPPAPHRRRWLWAAIPALAAVLTLLLVLPPAPTSQHGAELAGVREKGVAPYLRVFRQVPGGLEELGDADALGPGERLQISYAALGRPHGAVLSIDGRGSVTLHLPLDGDSSAELHPEGSVDLPASYQLDDAPGFERFVLLTARRPFALEPVLEAAHALAADPASARVEPLPLPRHLEQADFVIAKELGL